MAVAPLILAGAGKSAATAAVTSAAIGAGTQLAGGYLQHRGNSNAAKAQERARQEALAYERQRQADQQRRLQAYNDEYKKSWLDWYGRVGDEGLRRFGAPPVGIRIPGASQPATRGGAVRMEGSGVAPAPLATPQPTTPGMGPVTPIPGVVQPAPTQAPPSRMMDSQGASTETPIGGWSAWSQYTA